MFEAGLQHFPPKEYLEIISTNLFSSIAFINPHELYPKKDGLLILCDLAINKNKNLNSSLVFVKYYLKQKPMNSFWVNYTGPAIGMAIEDIAWNFINKNIDTIRGHKIVCFSDEILNSNFICNKDKQVIIFNMGLF